MRQVADRQVLAEPEFVVPAAPGQQERAVDRRRPDDVAVEHPGQVLADRVAVVRGLADRRPRVRRQQQRVRAGHPGQPQFAHRFADHVRVVPRLAGQRQCGVGRRGPYALDLRRRVTVEDRAVLSEGDLLRSVLDRLPVRVERAPLDGVDLGARQRERHPQFDNRLPGAQRRGHPVGRRGNPRHVPGADASQRQAVGPGHVDHLPRGGVQCERALGFLLKAGPCGGGDRGELAVQVVHRSPFRFALSNGCAVPGWLPLE